MASGTPTNLPAFSASTDRHQAPWLTELIGGVSGAIGMLAVVLTLGLLSWAPIGAHGAAVGLTASFVTVTVGGIVFALLSRGAMPTAGPSSATALILASLLATMVSDPIVAGDAPRGLPAMLAAAGLSVMLMGIGQLVLSYLRLGRLAQFVPQPVLAGFMNAVAVLILLAQVPTLLGHPVTGTSSWRHWLDHPLQPASLAIGLGTALVTALLAWRFPRVPAQLAGLIFGLALCAGVALLLPQLPFGELVGPLPAQLPLPELPLQLAVDGTAAVLWHFRLEVLSTGLVLALIGSLESVLGELALDQALDTRHDPDRLLLSLGWANVTLGVFSGLPAVVNRTRAIVTVQAGGRGRRAALIGAVTFGAMYVGCGPLLALVPKTVLAGIMLVVALSLSDRWTHRLIDQWRAGERSADVWQSLTIIGLVAGLTVGLGFVVGVFAGVLVVLLVFVFKLNRRLLRTRCTAAEWPSRRLYPPPLEAHLQVARKRIAVFELEGALFFGTAERLARAALNLPDRTRVLVLDLQRVATIDATGAVTLQQVSTLLAQRGLAVFLAGLADDHPHGQRLRAFGCFRTAPRQDWFPDLDRAIEAAERLLLREAGLESGDDAVPLHRSALFQGLSEAEVMQVTGHLRRVTLPAGATLFKQGDPGDSLYVLTRGSITVIAGAGPATAQRRYVSFSPSLMLGETAMLDGAGRSATATADSEVELFQLTQSALDDLQRESPALAVRLYRHISVHLSQRLRQATALPRPEAD